MTVEETRRVILATCLPSARPLERVVDLMEYRQRRNQGARVSHWKRSLGRRARPEVLDRVAAHPVRGITILM
jgi:hypothetical protein